LGEIVERVWTRAAALKVQQEMREGERKRWEGNAARRRAREATRSAEPERLKQTEDRVQRWHRAELLRGYAHALEAEMRRSKPHQSALTAAWIRNAADWLDPLIGKRWPEVDIDAWPDRGGSRTAAISVRNPTSP